MALELGTDVMLAGLSSADLNGRCGQITGAARGDGRWPVTLDGSVRTIAVRPGNLQLATAQPHHTGQWGHHDHRAAARLQRAACRVH